MQNPKEAIKQIQALTYGAYQASGQVAALIGASRPENMAEALEQTAARMEQGTVHLRALCESCLPPVPAVGQKPALPPLDAAGKVEVNEFSKPIPMQKEYAAHHALCPWIRPLARLNTSCAE